jgi:hypothetical protein
MAELPTRLGFSPTLGPALEDACHSLADAGRLVRQSDRVLLSDEGRRFLQQRLAELGVA